MNEYEEAEPESLIDPSCLSIPDSNDNKYIEAEPESLIDPSCLSIPDSNDNKYMKAEPESLIDPSCLSIPDSNKGEKHKRRSLSLREKLEIIEEIEAGKTRSQVSDDRDLPRSTVFSIWQTKHKIKSANAIHGRHDGCKRLRPSGYDEVDQALYRWWLHAKDKDMKISTSMLIEKAKSFASSLGVRLKNTGSWMDRFKIRHGIKLKSIEKLDVNELEERKDGFVKELPLLTRGKSYRDIYCVNEIGLFYHVLPDENQVFGGSGHVGCNKRVTLLLGTNMDGSDPLPPLVIGNSTALCSFENVESLSVLYYYNQYSWMTSQIWVDWIKAFDNRMHSLRRDVILFIDACPSHFTVTNLKAVRVKFVPASSKSFMPIMQGIMQRFKTWYRKLVLRDMVECINDSVEFRLDLLSGLHFIRKAWEHISQDCILNSFKLAGWTWDDNFSDNINFFEPLPSIAHECFKLNISESVFDEIIKAEECMSTREEITDQIIIESIASQSSVYLDNIEADCGDESDVTTNNAGGKNDMNISNSNGHNELDATEHQKPGLSDAKNAIQTLHEFLASVEEESKSEPVERRKRKNKPKKKTLEKGKVMSLNPEKGVFEMTKLKLL